MLVVTLLGSFWPTFVELHRRWSDFDGSYSYGYLVPLIAAYMCWLRLPVAGSTGASFSTTLTRLASLAAAIAAVMATLIWVISYLTFTGAIAQLMIPIILLSLMIVTLGISSSRNLFMPILFWHHSYASEVQDAGDGIGHTTILCHSWMLLRCRLYMRWRCCEGTWRHFR